MIGRKKTSIEDKFEAFTVVNTAQINQMIARVYKVELDNKELLTKTYKLEKQVDEMGQKLADFILRCGNDYMGLWLKIEELRHGKNGKRARVVKNKKRNP